MRVTFVLASGTAGRGRVRIPESRAALPRLGILSAGERRAGRSDLDLLHLWLDRHGRDAVLGVVDDPEHVARQRSLIRGTLLPPGAPRDGDAHKVRDEKRPGGHEREGPERQHDVVREVVGVLVAQAAHELDHAP